MTWRQRFYFTKSITINGFVQKWNK